MRLVVITGEYDRIGTYGIMAVRGEGDIAVIDKDYSSVLKSLKPGFEV